jgi:glycosyl transferase family 25
LVVDGELYRDLLVDFTSLPTNRKTQLNDNIYYNPITTMETIATFQLFPKTTLLDHTVYINLEERADRRKHTIKELRKLGITKPTRINAIKHDIGAIGCAKSHIIALERAKELGLNQVFICEDDITFLNPTLVVDHLQRFDSLKIPWDVILIAGNNSPPYQLINDICCRVSNFQTTTGYIVKDHYYDTLILNFKQGVANLEREPENSRIYALDIFWKTLQRRDRWYMIIPPTVIQYESYSDIEHRVVNYNALMLDMDKLWLRTGVNVPSTKAAEEKTT